MKLVDAQAFIGVHGNADKSLTVSVRNKVDKLFKNWTTSTRVSPVYCIDEPKRVSPRACLFTGEWNVVFLGPVQPTELPLPKDDEWRIWIGLGLFNVVFATKKARQASTLAKWAEKNTVPFERWKVTNGKVIGTSFSGGSTSNNQPWADLLVDAWPKGQAEIREAVQEYCPLMAASIARSELTTPSTHRILKQINEAVCEYITAPEPRGDSGHFRKLGEMLTINAALSRFSSQCYAGTSPIASTECHFWLHSLLGAGLASVAFQNLCNFVEHTLGAARIGQRFEALKRTRANFDIQKDEIPKQDYLMLNSVDNEPLIPVLGYFSARDGYRSTQWAVSAPLAVVSACNSNRWSLLTVTHEFTHIVIRSVLAELCPNFADENEVDVCVNLLRKDANRTTVFSQIQFGFFLCLMELEKIERNRQVRQIDRTEIQQLIHNWRHDVDEIMVHTFDFLYFYGRDVRKYVRGLWNSWSSIPNLSGRIPEYVVRTVCAVLSLHLNRGADGEAVAKETVLSELKDISTSRTSNEYILAAIYLLDNRWETEVVQKVRARRQLVKLVTCFLFSDTIATSIRKEPRAISGTRTRGGYGIVKLELSGRLASNPITFLEQFTTNSLPNAADSAWMLHILAFDSGGDDLGKA